MGIKAPYPPSPYPPKAPYEPRTMRNLHFEAVSIDALSESSGAAPHLLSPFFKLQV